MLRVAESAVLAAARCLLTFPDIFSSRMSLSDKMEADGTPGQRSETERAVTNASNPTASPLQTPS